MTGVSTFGDYGDEEIMGILGYELWTCRSRALTTTNQKHISHDISHLIIPMNEGAETPVNDARLR